MSEVASLPRRLSPPGPTPVCRVGPARTITRSWRALRAGTGLQSACQCPALEERAVRSSRRWRTHARDGQTRSRRPRGPARRRRFGRSGRCRSATSSRSLARGRTPRACLSQFWHASHQQLAFRVAGQAPRRPARRSWKGTQRGRALDSGQIGGLRAEGLDHADRHDRHRSRGPVWWGKSGRQWKARPPPPRRSPRPTFFVALLPKEP